MINNSDQKAGLPFYTEERFQDRSKWWVESVYRLISPHDRFLPFQIMKNPTEGTGGSACPETPASVAYTGNFTTLDGWTVVGGTDAAPPVLSVNAGRLRVDVPETSNGFALVRKLTALDYLYSAATLNFDIESVESIEIRRIEAVSIYDDAGIATNPAYSIQGGFVYSKSITLDSANDILKISIRSMPGGGHLYLNSYSITATPTNYLAVSNAYTGYPFTTTDGWSPQSGVLSVFTSKLRGTGVSFISKNFSTDITLARKLTITINADIAGDYYMYGCNVTLGRANGSTALISTQDFFFWDFANGGNYVLNINNNSEYTSLVKIQVGIETSGAPDIMDFDLINVDLGEPCIEPVTDIWTDAAVVNVETLAEIDVTGYVNSETETVDFDDFQVALYKGLNVLPANMVPALYYLRLSDGADTFYSEAFLPCANLDDYIKIEWWRDIDIVYTDGRTVYSTGYINTLYLDGDIGKPEHTYTIDQTVRDGFKFKEKVVSVKKFKVKNLLLSEPVIDLLARLPHYEYILVNSRGLQYTLIDITIPTPEWDEVGDVASLEIEFETDTIISTGTSVAQNYNQLLSDPTDAINIRGNNKRIFQLGDASGTGGLYVAADKASGSEAVKVLVSSLAGLSDAPLDGANYGRKDGGWADTTKEVPSISFVPGPVTPSPEDYLLFPDDIRKTLAYYRDGKTFPDWIGTNQIIPFKNTTGATILKGTPVSVIGLDPTTGVVTVTPTLSSDKDLSILFAGVAENDVLDGEIGKGARFEFITDFDTSIFTSPEVGQPLYVDPTSGMLTNVEPMAPNYALLAGTIAVVGTGGILSIEVNNLSTNDTAVNVAGSLNGVVTASPEVVFSVSGGVIYADITNEKYPTENLPFLMHGVTYMLDTTTNTGPGGAARVTIPPGLDAETLQLSTISIFLNRDTAELVVATSELPVPYAVISTQAVFDAARTDADGKPFMYRRFNNAVNLLDGNHDGSHGITEQILSAFREKLGSNWSSGQDGTATVGNTQIRVALTAGVGRQFRKASLPAFDGLEYTIYNNASNLATWESSTNLIDIDADASGNSLLANNTFYTIRIFYQLNSNGVGNNVIATRPLGSYTTPGEAVSDPLGYAVSVGSTITEEVVYPLYDLVISRAGGGGTTITLVELVDKRSKLNRESGGGSSSGGGTDDKIRISASDTTNDYATAKFTGKTGELETTVINPGGNEQLEFSLPDTVVKSLTVDGNFQVTGQAHAGNSAEAFSATKTFDANSGTIQKMPVTASTTIEITNELPGSYIFKFVIDSVSAPVITIGASFGNPMDNNAAMLTGFGDVNTIGLIVDPDGIKEYTINTRTA